MILNGSVAQAAHPAYWFRRMVVFEGHSLVGHGVRRKIATLLDL